MDVDTVCVNRSITLVQGLAKAILSASSATLTQMVTPRQVSNMLSKVPRGALNAQGQYNKIILVYAVKI